MINIGIGGYNMSRLITEQACKSFWNSKPFKKDNTEITILKNAIGDITIAKMYLFGNCIAIRDLITRTTIVSFRGWYTVTTKERLNGLTNVSFRFKKGKIYMDDKEINANDWYAI